MQQYPYYSKGFLLLQSVREQRGGQIAVAGVGQQGHNGLALVLGALGQLDGSPQRSAGGNTYQHALLVADQLAGGKGVLVGNGDDFVVNLGAQDSGTKPAPMP